MSTTFTTTELKRLLGKYDRPVVIVLPDGSHLDLIGALVSSDNELHLITAEPEANVATSPVA